jgi:hypothetical protein
MELRASRDISVHLTDANLRSEADVVEWGDWTMPSDMSKDATATQWHMY